MTLWSDLLQETISRRDLNVKPSADGRGITKIHPLLLATYGASHNPARCAQLPSRMRIPMKSAIDSETKPATYSDFIPATVPI